MFIYFDSSSEVIGLYIGFHEAYDAVWCLGEVVTDACLTLVAVFV